jgi:hypothetical protein
MRTVHRMGGEMIVHKDTGFMLCGDGTTPTVKDSLTTAPPPPIQTLRCTNALRWNSELSNGRQAHD